MPAEPIGPIRLSDDERERLAELVRCPDTPLAIGRRAHIILLAAQGGSIAEISRSAGVSRSAVARWRNRFIDAGLRGLDSEPRSGAPRQIPADVLARVLRMSLSGRAAWSTRVIADAADVSQSTVCRIRRQFGVHPGIEGTGDPDVLALFEPGRPVVTGLFVTPARASLAVDGGRSGASVLVLCGAEDETPALPGPRLRLDGGDDPLAVIHVWLHFLDELGRPAVTPRGRRRASVPARCSSRPGPPAACNRSSSFRP